MFKRTMNNLGSVLVSAVKLAAYAVFFSLPTWIVAATASENSNEVTEKAKLIGLVDSHLDTISLGSEIKFIDFATLNPVAAVITDTHPMLFQAEDYFVACITAIDVEGTEYPIDIYIFKSGSDLKVTDMKFGQNGRNDLMRLMEKGLVSEY
jgi:hypothetical protein